MKASIRKLKRDKKEEEEIREQKPKTQINKKKCNLKCVTHGKQAYYKSNNKICGPHLASETHSLNP